MIHSDVQLPLIPCQDEISEDRPYSFERISSHVNSSSFYPLPEIKVGETMYKLLSSIDTLVSFDPIDKKWECRNVSGTFKYIGVSEARREDAIENFKLKIHIRFQQLYSKRPFEMTEDEYNEWIKLANTIDLLHYKTTNPIETREVGCISYWKVSYPYRIKWLTDENYIINPLNVPGELMSYKPGQWIEAAVKRHPVSHKILSISSIKKIRFHIPRPEEAQSDWDNMEKIQLNKTPV
jgi:hypothetical protein